MENEVQSECYLCEGRGGWFLNPLFAHKPGDPEAPGWFKCSDCDGTGKSVRASMEPS